MNEFATILGGMKLVSEMTAFELYGLLMLFTAFLLFNYLAVWKMFYANKERPLSPLGKIVLSVIPIGSIVIPAYFGLQTMAQ